MKRTIHYSARLLMLCLAAGLFTQCNFKTVSISTLRPAAITFPSNINTLLLLDRTVYEHRRDEVIHDIFSGGIPGEDRSALQSAMSSLNQTLQQSPRFKTIMATEVFKGNSLTNAFPNPLPWDEIESLCAEYKADAIVSFELFGSNFVITQGDRIVKKKEKNDKGEEVERERKEYYAKGVGSIRMGIRIYDPKNRSLIDQQLFTKYNNWEATGSTIRDALAALIAKSEATRQVASAAASDYAYKIAPMPVRLSREFYVKSSKVPAIEEGTRKTEVNDWQGALSTWQNALTPQTPRKQAGQLCYNIAVAYEVLGDLDNAKKWASRAYIDYGNKKGRDYSNVIDARMADEHRVDEQMK